MSEADLTTATISHDPALHALPVGARGEVVGRVAAVDLRPGQVVTRDSVTTENLPHANQQLVGVALAPTQMPAQGLRPGQPVLVVTTPSVDGDVPEGAPPVIAATVARVGPVDPATPEGKAVVDLIAAPSDGPVLAARAATGRIAVVVEPRGE